MPCAEVFASTPQHNDFDAVVINGTSKACVQRIRHLRILNIVKIGSVHGERGDTIRNFIKHRFLRFVNSLVFALNKLIAGVGVCHGVYPNAVARRLCGSSLANKANWSAVGSGVTGMLAGKCNSKPVAS